MGVTESDWRVQRWMVLEKKLHRCPHWAIHRILYGGYNPRRPPREFDWRRIKEGKDVNGLPFYRWHIEIRRRRRVKGYDGLDEYAPPQHESSPETVLSLIRAMRRSGYSEEETREIAMDSVAVGFGWLWWHRDPESEFTRAWEKAGLDRKHWRRRKDVKRFVSNVTDQEKIYATIEATPGISHGAIWESGVLTGRYPHGRYDAALKALLKAGWIGVMRLAHNRHAYWALTLHDAPQPEKTLADEIQEALDEGNDFYAAILQQALDDEEENRRHITCEMPEPATEPVPATCTITAPHGSTNPVGRGYTSLSNMSSIHTSHMPSPPWGEGKLEIQHQRSAASHMTRSTRRRQIKPRVVVFRGWDREITDLMRC